MGLIQILKLFGMFKDVRKAVAEQKGQSGWWYSRKFIGSLLVFAAAVVLYLTGVQIEPDMLDRITGNISDLLTSIVGLYGIVLFMVSLFKKKSGT